MLVRKKKKINILSKKTTEWSSTGQDEHWRLPGPVIVICSSSFDSWTRLVGYPVSSGKVNVLKSAWIILFPLKSSCRNCSHRKKKDGAESPPPPLHAWIPPPHACAKLCKNPSSFLSVNNWLMRIQPQGFTGLLHNAVWNSHPFVHHRRSSILMGVLE